MKCLSVALLPFDGNGRGGLLRRLGGAGDYFAAQLLGGSVEVVRLYVAGIKRGDDAGDGSGVPQQCAAGLGGDRRVCDFLAAVVAYAVAVCVDIDKRTAVEIDVVVVAGVALFGAEDGGHVAAAGDDEVGIFEIFEDGGHDAGDAGLAVGRESGQIDHDGLALRGVGEQLGHALAHTAVEGIEAAENDDVALIDAWPDDIEAVVGIFFVAGDADRAVSAGYVDLYRSVAFGVAVD